MLLFRLDIVPEGLGVSPNSSFSPNSGGSRGLICSGCSTRPTSGDSGMVESVLPNCRRPQPGWVP
jgi:hypothetical protein